jgi:hypothetical protein
MPTLVNFGDSWAWGSELSDREKTYSKIVSRGLNIDCLDYSVPSSSVPGLCLQFRRFIDQHYQPDQDYIALFFITSRDRQLLEINGDLHEGSISDNRYLPYYSRYYGEQIGYQVMNTAILSLQAMCRYYGIMDTYIAGWQVPKFWPEVDLSSVYDRGQTTAMKLFTGDDSEEVNELVHRHPEMWSGYHPSELAHSIVAEHLGKWIYRLYKERKQSV